MFVVSAITLMDGLQFSFDGYDIEECSRDVGARLHEKANEVISLFPEGINFGDGPDPALFSDHLGDPTAEHNDPSNPLGDSIEHNDTSVQVDHISSTSCREDQDTLTFSLEPPMDDGILAFCKLIYILFA